ncbi:acyltransferase [Pararoseomonas sp. SCSIO 73927]|uniref:acyltransferase family protein n=1 Tax=Pararoseomonas sp. SCSIO 73927 TaxID=3114537 RepID=UPI0030D628E7
MMNGTALAPRQDIPALTGARGPAALAVVAYHLSLDHTAEPYASWFGLEVLFGRGSLGVDFFFILSGFIIHHVYRDAFAAGLRWRDAGRFLLYRFARIWPLHMVTMLGALLLFAVAALVFGRVPADPANAAAYTPTGVLLSALMVQTWFGYASPNVPAWSISAEWTAYIAYPLLCRLLLRLPTPGWVLLGLLALLGTGTALVGHPIGRIACGFTLGLVLREAEGRWNLSRRLDRRAGAAVAAAVLAGCWLLPDDSLLPFVAAFALFVLALCNPRDLLGRAMARPAVVYLGEISFALYMVHAVVWSAYKNAMRVLAPGVDAAHPLSVLPAVALCLVAAALLHRLVELPARDLLRAERRRAPREGAKAAAPGGLAVRPETGR